MATRSHFAGANRKWAVVGMCALSLALVPAFGCGEDEPAPTAGAPPETAKDEANGGPGVATETQGRGDGQATRKPDGRREPGDDSDLDRGDDRSGFDQRGDPGSKVTERDDDGSKRPLSKEQKELLERDEEGEQEHPSGSESDRPERDDE